MNMGFVIREVINVSGTMTALGSCSVAPEVIQAMVEVLPKFVDMVDLQRQASKVIRRVIGAEAGCITSSAAAGMAICVAACMTGRDMARVEQLPDTTGLKDEVVIQRGHVVWFGASVPQMVRLSGAKVVEIGDATRAGVYQLEGRLCENTAAALYVVSHHTVQYGLIALEEFCRVAHAHGVPVVVDAASESNMRSFVERGADLVCFSGHKFLSGPTSGIIAGKRDLVEACLYHQYHGIGRAMKVGKEGIVGAMAALLRWEALDHEDERHKQGAILNEFVRGLSGLSGIEVSVEPDPTGNPISRVKVAVDPELAGLTAYHLAAALAAREPPIMVRDHHAIDEGVLFLDPCVVRADQVSTVLAAIRGLVESSAPTKETIRRKHQGIPNQADLQIRSLTNWIGEG
ncbi:MAG: L-seryl-tRNA(Sec) selenium transferase-related protein [Candidatus Bipolaricaulis sibiricus]|uniref:L-seryl-tRNA(Sec) selenium transferase-related protein n=1 Tax=Bipolaricaulis sibiricus TaxID=2501609 RepID=A0A410FVL9_BIPS1|nr:MAG: L-seryl-tRNA(Sec) selenium transferase-related protein [Candidatus Bipolaricaulis sibiricus]